jgi:type I restriction-modification system DNA methylase subunit
MGTDHSQITLPVLENHLWEAANILRGPVDAADFKSYIFPLLFFKRISYVFDEEVAAALEESGEIRTMRYSLRTTAFKTPKNVTSGTYARRRVTSAPQSSTP